ISTELKRVSSTAEKENADGDALGAWRQYKQIAAGYEGVSDVSAFLTKAQELSRTKAAQEALKRERNDFADQERLSNQILGALQAKENLEMSHSEGQENATRDVRELRLRGESERKLERAIVLKRALAGIFIGAIETGNGALERKDYRVAARYFSAAAEARSDSEWPLRQLAVAQALGRARKAAVETLKRVKKAAKEPNKFYEWVQSEPAFADLRGRSEMGELGVS